MAHTNILALYKLKAHFNIELLHQTLIHLLNSFNSPPIASRVVAANAATTRDMSASVTSFYLSFTQLSPQIPSIWPPFRAATYPIAAQQYSPFPFPFTRLSRYAQTFMLSTHSMLISTYISFTNHLFTSLIRIWRLPHLPQRHQLYLSFTSNPLHPSALILCRPPIWSFTIKISLSLSSPMHYIFQLIANIWNTFQF